MMARKRPITEGERFARASTPGHVYVVTALVDKPGHLPHVRLSAEGGVAADEILVSASALLDPTLWRRIG